MTVDPLVLAVDDEPGVLRLIKLGLTANGFRVITCESAEEAERLAEEHRPDIVLLDVVMPDMSGYEVMRRLRDRTDIPIIMLTAKDRDADKVKGLELGGDDYVAKPFSPDELAARVRAVLRRSMGTQVIEGVVEAGNVTIDLNARTVTRGGEPVSLTRTEWMLLQHLAANPGKLMLSAELLSKVWGPEYRADLQYLRVWVSRLRQKLEDEPSRPRLLKTFAGLGYMFDTPAEDEPAEATAELATA